MAHKLVAIVPAAGIGARAQASGPSGAALDAHALPKQYRLLKGEPMLRRAVKALLADERIAQVRVAVAAGDPWAAQALSGLPRTVWRSCGGATRAATVSAALRDAALDPDDWVLVHDAARPGLPAADLARLIDHCVQTGAGGLLARQVPDTVKRQADGAAGQPADGQDAGTGAGRGGQGSADDARQSDGVAIVRESVPRDGLWLAQTPQMFQAGRLLAALDAAAQDGAAVTDEASAMELAGHAPSLVPGSVRNFKITWPEDFELMEKWL